MITLWCQVVVQHRSANLHRIKVGAWGVSSTEARSVPIKMYALSRWYEDRLKTFTKISFHHFHKGFIEVSSVFFMYASNDFSKSSDMGKLKFCLITLMSSSTSL